MLRAHGVVGKFVEFFGPGLSSLSIADRATLSNMSPEFGATSTLFPVDSNTLKYLHLTGRGAIVDLVERYTREQGLFRTDDDPEPLFNEVLDLDLEPRSSRASPARSGRRIAWRLRGVARVLPGSLRIGGSAAEVSAKAIARLDRRRRHPQRASSRSAAGASAQPRCRSGCDRRIRRHRGDHELHQYLQPFGHDRGGTAGAQGGRSAGLQCKPWVKTSLAPGSRVVTQYLDKAGLTPYLENARASTWWATAARPASATPGRCPNEIAEAVSEQRSGGGCGAVGQPKFRGAHPRARSRRATWPPRRCVSRTRWPERFCAT